MDVFVANEQDLPVDESRLAALAQHVLLSEGVDDDSELSVLFVSSSHIRRLNARFARDDYPTDVLSFPMMEEDEDALILGDVVICPRIARQNATRLNHPLSHELEVLLIHGILHLLGYDHQSKEDKTKMDRRMRDLLDSFAHTLLR